MNLLGIIFDPLSILFWVFLALFPRGKRLSQPGPLRFMATESVEGVGKYGNLWMIGGVVGFIGITAFVSFFSSSFKVCYNSKHDTHLLVYTFIQALKTLDTIGNCQRPVFSLAVSQHVHKITNL